MQKKILIVDDEILIAESLKANLEEVIGYTVDTVYSGEAALAQLLQHKYHLVITDMMMGGIDGIELVTKLREQDSTISVIVTSGYAESEQIITDMQINTVEYLAKPYSHEELLLRIENCFVKQEL